MVYELLRAMTSDNFIYIGSKPFMNYVTSVVIQFTTKEAIEVLVRARGQFITRAVDVAQVACNRFLKDHIRVKEVSIGSEEFQNAEGKDVRVSTIDIILQKK